MAGATLEIDKEQVRVMVHTHGCRATARILGMSEDTVKSWSRRYGWIEELKPRPLPASMVKTIAPNAPSPAEKQAELYRSQRVETRLNISGAALKASKRLAEKSPDELLSDGGTTLKTVAQAASLVHGWQEQTQSRVVVCLQALEQSQIDVTPSPSEGSEEIDPMFE